MALSKELKKWVDEVVLKGHTEEEVKNYLSGKLDAKEQKKVLDRYKGKSGKSKNKGALVIEDPETKLSKEEIEFCTKSLNRLTKEVSKAVIGQEAAVHGVVLGLLCNGHVLLEGVPGIAKTLMVKSIARATGCDVKRIQFTVDLLPTDILGITTYHPETGFETEKGPVFTNFLIADEINRSPPKTQSALMEAMQEKQVTIGKKTIQLPDPFFVMATMNPLENAGVYPLPEAQVDRFLFKIKVGYPREHEEMTIMEDNMSLRDFEDFGIEKVLSPKDIIKMQELVKKVYLGDHIKKYILAIVRLTRDPNFSFAEYLDYGVSPRSSIAFFIAAKANAIVNGRDFVLPGDVNKVVHDILRHRLILSYKATVKDLTADKIIDEVLKEVKK